MIELQFTYSEIKAIVSLLDNMNHPENQHLNILQNIETQLVAHTDNTANLLDDIHVVHTKMTTKL